MFQIVHFQKILEIQCLNKIKLTAPLYILLAICIKILAVTLFIDEMENLYDDIFVLVCRTQVSW